MSQNTKNTEDASYKVVGTSHGHIIKNDKIAPLTAATKEEAYKQFKTVLREMLSLLRVNTIIDDDWTYVEDGEFLSLESNQYDCSVQIIPNKK